MNSVTTSALHTVAHFLSGGTPSKANPDYWAGSIPWLTPKDMASFDGSTEEHVTEAAIGNGSRIAPAGSIFVAVRGMSLHNEIRVVRPSSSISFNQDIKAIVPNGIDGDYLYYAITHLKSRLLSLVEAAGHGTGVLPTGQLANLEIPRLGTNEAAVGRLFRALDDKIDLNRQTNGTLERTASVIFKDWFVDFGPTRTKMENGEQYLAPELWALFPDRLDGNGLPSEWEERPIGTFLQDNVGGDWGKDVSEGDFCHPVFVIRGTDFPGILLGGTGKVPRRFTTRKKLEKRTLNHGDIVIEVSGGSPTQPTGRSVRVTKSILDRFDTSVVCASFCRRFRPRSAEVGILIAQHLKDLYARGGTWEYQNQSTGISNFQTTYFLGAEKVIWPGEAVCNAFVSIVEPMFTTASSNESLTLEAMRDLLLEEIFTGKLHPPNAEKDREAAA